jgi:hypothetical protein
MCRAPIAIVLAAIVITAAGCSSCGEVGCDRSGDNVPVSLEGLYDVVSVAAPSTWFCPYSCPPCPYYDYRAKCWYDDPYGNCAGPEACPPYSSQPAAMSGPPAGAGPTIPADPHHGLITPGTAAP